MIKKGISCREYWICDRIASQIVFTSDMVLMMCRIFGCQLFLSVHLNYTLVLHLMHTFLDVHEKNLDTQRTMFESIDWKKNVFKECNNLVLKRFHVWINFSVFREQFLIALFRMGVKIFNISNHIQWRKTMKRLLINHKLR